MSYRKISIILRKEKRKKVATNCPVINIYYKKNYIYCDN